MITTETQKMPQTDFDALMTEVGGALRHIVREHKPSQMLTMLLSAVVCDNHELCPVSEKYMLDTLMVNEEFAAPSLQTTLLINYANHCVLRGRLVPAAFVIHQSNEGIEIFGITLDGAISGKILYPVVLEDGKICLGIPRQYPDGTPPLILRRFVTAYNNLFQEIANTRTELLDME